MHNEQNSALAASARSINQALAAGSAMKIGETIMHPDGYQVHIISGCFLDPVYQRVSNHWSWKRVNPDGSLSDQIESGYGW